MLPQWIDSLVTEPDRELAVVELGAAFLNASAEERQILLAGWNFGVHWPYPNGERLSCQRRERTTPRERIVASLVLDALEGAWKNWPEFVVGLAHSYRSAELAGLDPRQLFTTVAAQMPEPMADELQKFLARPAADRAPAAFNIKERSNAEGEVEAYVDWFGGH